MKTGQKVKFKQTGKIAIVVGPVEKYGVRWFLIEYKDKTKAIVLESFLEVINE